MSREQDILVLSLKSDINNLLGQKGLNDYEYGLLRGYSSALFTLDHITEEEYKTIFCKGNSKWGIK